MIKYVAVVEDTGELYKVINIKLKTDQNIDGMLVINVPETTKNEILKNFELGNSIYLSKEIKYEPVPEDLIIKTHTPKERILFDIKQIAQRNINKICNTVTNFDIFNMIMANNTLSSHGYFITDQNKETEYIKIINTGDMTLIDNLERYLICLDKISPSVWAYNKYRELEKELDCIDFDVNIDEGVAQANKLLSNFLNAL